MLLLESIVIATRFRGPAASGNGGYTCGRVAAFVDADTVEVTLRLPPPLETPLRVERNGGVRVFDGDRLVAEAKPSQLALEPPPAPSFAEAAALAAAHPVDPDHPFPGCFTCGPSGEGLRLNPTPVGDGRVVAPWRPDESLAELVWAALDCPGAFAVDPGFSRGISVLGRLTARIDEVPEPGDECVVVAWPIGGQGRKLLAGTALYREENLLGMALATWITVGDELRDAVPSAP
jgi:hypothetical protein